MEHSKLKDFEILSRLGAGSFGTVYKVRRFADNLIYVIKNVRIAELSYREQTEAINEVQILAQLKSPFVVRYFDSFIDKESLNIGKNILFVYFISSDKYISSRIILSYGIL